MKSVSHRVIVSLLCWAPLLGTLAPVSYAADEVLLFEDFEDGVADEVEPQDDLWEVVEGVYHCHATGYNYYSKSLAGSEAWTDYVFECDIRVEGSISQMVFVRLQDLGNFYEINVRGDPYNDVLLFKWIDGIQHFLHSAPFANQTGTWKHYTIRAIGHEITVEFDGNELLSYTDQADPFLSGRISLVCHTGGEIQWQDAYFDNVLVYVPVIDMETSSWGAVKSLYR
jgi:hypothetical protein